MKPEELALASTCPNARWLVLAGGRGSRLKNLTDRRAKPAVLLRRQVPHHRLRAVNCLNSGIRRIGVITQYKATACCATCSAAGPS